MAGHSRELSRRPRQRSTTCNVTTDVKLWKRALLVVIVLGLVIVVPLVVLVKIRARQHELQRRGVETQALVVGTDARSDTEYLIVQLAECGCRIAVPTSSAARHPVGSLLPVRYDPTRPGRAEALVDAPDAADQALVMLVTGVAMVIVMTPLVVYGFRRQIRARRLVDESAPRERVRVEAWRRAYLHSTIPYLSVYRVDEPEGGPAMLSLAVTEETMAKVVDLDDWRFELFGGQQTGQPVALRQGDFIIAAGSTKSGEWERKHRTVHGAVAPNAKVEPAYGGIFGDEREARAFRRLQALLRLVIVAFIPLLALRVVPEPWMPAALVATFVICGAIGILWLSMRRLLTRLATRLPGSPAMTRAGRRLAREDVLRRINSTSGEAELASWLNTTPETLAMSQRHASRWIYSSLAITGTFVAVAFVRLVVST